MQTLKRLIQAYWLAWALISIGGLMGMSFWYQQTSLEDFRQRMIEDIPVRDETRRLLLQGDKDEIANQKRIVNNEKEIIRLLQSLGAK